MRWGTALHDRFMLEHFVWQDFLEVLDDLATPAIRSIRRGSRRSANSAFPFYGAVEAGGVQLELRHALEPWHVLGEEGAAGGTARFVDSSVERLQVKVEGSMPARHVGDLQRPARAARPPPAAPGNSSPACASRPGSSPSALHPTIDVHAPLTFDIYDTWSGRSLGGCIYHVAHPGGRNYETFPVNSYEAEARRLARFQDHGHTPGILHDSRRRNAARISGDARPAAANSV